MSRQVMLTAAPKTLSERFGMYPKPPRKAPKKTTFASGKNKVTRQVATGVSKQRRQNVVMQRRSEQAGRGPIRGPMRGAGRRAPPGRNIRRVPVVINNKTGPISGRTRSAIRAAGGRSTRGGRQVGRGGRQVGGGARGSGNRGASQTVRGARSAIGRVQQNKGGRNQTSQKKKTQKNNNQQKKKNTKKNTQKNTQQNKKKNTKKNTKQTQKPKQQKPQQQKKKAPAKKAKPAKPKAKPLTQQQLDDELDRMMGRDPAVEKKKREAEALDAEMDEYRNSGPKAAAE